MITQTHVLEMSDAAARDYLIATCGSAAAAAEFAERVIGCEQLDQPEAVNRALRDAASECGYETAEGRAATQAVEDAMECVTVNGVMYRTPEQAAAVRAALVAAGIGHHYPGTPQAILALRAAGIE